MFRKILSAAVVIALGFSTAACSYRSHNDRYEFTEMPGLFTSQSVLEDRKDGAKNVAQGPGAITAGLNAIGIAADYAGRRTLANATVKAAKLNSDAGPGVVNYNVNHQSQGQLQAQKNGSNTAIANSKSGANVDVDVEANSTTFVKGH